MVPKREGDSKRGDKREEDKRSRRERIIEANGEDAAALRPPPLEPEGLCTQYLQMLFEAGAVGHAGMGGQIALSWQELRAWRLETATILSPPERRLLRELSSVYARALQTMAEADAVPAWLEADEDYQSDREDQIVRFFEALAGPQRKGKP